MATEGSLKIDNFRRIPGTKLYRSSKPDTPSSELLFKEQNIKTIIDLSTDEVDDTHTSIDDTYPPFILKIPFYGAGTKPNLVSICEANQNLEEQCDEEGRYRLSVPLSSIRKLLLSSPWYIKLVIVLGALIDRLLGTTLALKAMVHLVLKPLGASFVEWILKRTLIEYGAEIASILHLLCLPEYTPAVIICGLGKDRTGLLAALISHICGRAREDIINDYTQSTKELPKDKKQLLKYDKLGVHHAAKLAQPETLINLFEFLEQRYGSVDGYLETIGFGLEDQEKLRRNILSKD